MALGEICCTIDISKTRSSSKTGFLFFLLLQMSLLSKVWTTSTTASPATTLKTDAKSSTVSDPVTQSLTTQSTYPVSTSSSISTDQMATSGSTVTGASSTSTQNTASNSATVASAGITSMETANISSSENYTALSCPAFACTKDCYDQFMNMTAKPCQSSEYFCKIMKGDAGYSVSCSASCGVPCENGTLSNCSVNCCNTTNCLNNSLLAMFNSLNTTATTKPTTTTTTIKTTVPTTPASNGKKCHNFKCNGAACYKANVASNAACPVGLDYCMLQKTTSGTTESWQAGCSTDCRKMTACSSTSTACHLECCNATTTSCLKLTGEVNMPSSATRSPHCPALLMASLLFFWIVKILN
ncbi:keratin-associated protein 10-12 isoform X2 [Cyprinus carpio]|uniref:Keratin-associated protein 10-12 isoform X2 n=1 Tax=Cyprinus carpio TaxID=7962 RepID=A0A9R0AF14_CYPCA|nr:keratin-associated protein 10-12 isoform X2 [Cyprinus carpio]